MSVLVRAYYRPEHAQAAPHFCDPADAQRLIDELLALPGGHSEASLAPADEHGTDEFGLPSTELRVAVNAEEQVGGLRWMGADGVFYTRGRDNPTDPILYSCWTESSEYPPDSEITIDALRRAVAEFLHTGCRPTSVAWQPDPYADELEAAIAALALHDDQ